MNLNGAPGAGDGGSEPRPYRIILVDPQRLFRQALRALLDAQAGFTVVGETGSAAEALELAGALRSEEHTSELQSHVKLVCRPLLEKKTHTPRPRRAPPRRRTPAAGARP